MQETLVRFLGQEYPLEKEIATHSGFPGGSDGKASAYNVGVPGSIPSREDPLEKEMATHSNVLAWKIPWMEEPGRLQSMGSQSQTQLSNFTFTIIKEN